MKFYIISFDRPQNGRYKEFHEDFIKHPDIRKWWHYIKSCYIIGTEMRGRQLSEHYQEIATKYGLPSSHLVLRVNLRGRYGWLPKRAWEWIDKAKADETPQ